MAAIATSYRPKLAFQPAVAAAEDATTQVHHQLRGDIAHHASGSASCELGRTKVVCQVFGPRARKAQGKAEFEGRGAVDVDATFVASPGDVFAAASSSSSSSSSSSVEQLRARRNRELSLFLEDAVQASVQLERFPKSVLDVSVQVVEDDGSAFACAAVCVSFALAKCGVEMYDLVSAVTLVQSSKEEALLLAPHPNKRQEDGGAARCTVAMFAQSGQLTAFHLDSSSSSSSVLASMLAAAREECQQVDARMRAQLVSEEEEFVL